MDQRAILERELAKKSTTGEAREQLQHALDTLNEGEKPAPKPAPQKKESLEEGRERKRDEWKTKRDEKTQRVEKILKSGERATTWQRFVAINKGSGKSMTQLGKEWKALNPDKATPKKTSKKKPKASAKQVKEKTAKVMKKAGMTLAECNEIIKKYEDLHKKAKTRAKQLKKEGKIIKGTDVKTASASIDTSSKQVAKKIETQVDKGADLKALSKKMVAKAKSFMNDIATAIAKDSKKDAKSFLKQLHTEIGKLLKKKYEWGGGIGYEDGGEVIDTFTAIQGDKVMANNPYTIEKEDEFYVIKNNKGEVLARDKTKEGIMNDKGMFLNLYAKGSEIQTYDIEQMEYGMVDYSKDGYVKAIRDINGKLMKEVVVSGVKYRRNPTYKTYNSINGNELLHKSKYAKGGDTYQDGGEINSYNNPEDDIHVLHIDGQNWYLVKIDSTHFYMSNNPDGRGMAHHIGQHSGEPYYDEVRQWLKDTTYSKGGEIQTYDIEQMEYGGEIKWWSVELKMPNGEIVYEDVMAEDKDDAEYYGELTDWANEGGKVLSVKFKGTETYAKGGKIKKHHYDKLNDVLVVVVDRNTIDQVTDFSEKYKDVDGWNANDLQNPQSDVRYYVPKPNMVKWNKILESSSTYAKGGYADGGVLGEIDSMLPSANDLSVIQPMASGGEITYKIENYHSGFYLDDKEFDSEKEATNYLYETLDVDDEDFDDWYVMGEYYKDGKWVNVPIEYAKGGKIKKGDKIKVLRGIYGNWDNPYYKGKIFTVLNVHNDRVDIEERRETIPLSGVEKVSTYAKGGKVSQFADIKKNNVISEKEINLIKNRMNNKRVDTDTQEIIDYIWENNPTLTPEQNKKGIDYLRNLWKTPKGKERLNSPFGYREQDALEKFSHFDLAGFHDAGNQYVTFYVPIYDVIATDGYGFQYYFSGGEVHIIGAKGMTIYDIKRETSETSPYYFDRKTMQHFGQTLKDFKVKKMADGRFKISAPSYDYDQSTGLSRYMGDSVRFFNPETKELDSKARGGEIEKESVNEIIKEVVGEMVEENLSSNEVSESIQEWNEEEVETESRSGFIPYTDGGVEYTGFAYMSSMNGAGESMPTESSQKEFERQVENGYEMAQEQFREDNPELVKELGEDKINYSDLYEADKGEEAERLSEMEMDFMDDSIMYQIGAYYYDPNNSKGELGKNSIMLFGVVNLESPYHRRGNFEDYKEIFFEFSNLSDLRKKLKTHTADIIDWLQGGQYSTSEKRELKFARWGEGGQLSVPYAKGGMTKHALEVGDTIIEDVSKSNKIYRGIPEGKKRPIMFEDDAVVVKNQGQVAWVDLDKGKRANKKKKGKKKKVSFLYDEKSYRKAGGRRWWEFEKGGSTYQEGGALYEKATQKRYLEKYAKNGNLIRTAEQFDSGNWVVSEYPPSKTNLQGEYTNEEFKEIRKYFYAKGGSTKI